MRPGAAVLFGAVLLTGLTLSVSLWSQTTGGHVAYSPSRNAFGQSDLQGIWQALNAAAWDIQDHSEQRFPGLPTRFSVPAGQGVVEGNVTPYQSWASAQRVENSKNRLTADPEVKCYSARLPRSSEVAWEVRNNANCANKRKPSEILRSQVIVDMMVFSEEDLRHLIAEMGVGQVVYGTDVPLNWPVTVDLVLHAKFLSDAHKIAILSGTLQKLLRIS